MIKITCPSCKKDSTWENNPTRPFCSERCKLIDLGQWADEKYRIPTTENFTQEPVTQNSEDPENN